MTTTKNPNGSLTVSAVIDGYLTSKTYYGYTNGEAIALFNEEYPSGDDDGDTLLTCDTCGDLYLHWQACQH